MQLEFAVVEYIGWFNNSRLHRSLGFLPPAEHELRSELTHLEKLGARTAATALQGWGAPVGPSCTTVQSTRSLETENS